jgi:hypothetical protein
VTTTVIVRRVDTGETVVGKLDDDDNLTGGYGGWTTLDRPRRRAAVAWVGTPGATYTLPLALDGMETTPGVDTSVEPSCNLLETWGRSPDPVTPPPVLQVFGDLLVAPTSGWALQDLSWGVRERNSAGERIRQVVTLTLLQTDDPAVASGGGSAAAKVRRHRKRDSIVVPPGPWPGNHDDGPKGTGGGGKGWPAH